MYLVIITYITIHSIINIITLLITHSTYLSAFQVNKLTGIQKDCILVCLFNSEWNLIYMLPYNPYPFELQWLHNDVKLVSH